MKIKLFFTILSIIILSSCASSSIIDKSGNCQYVKYGVDSFTKKSTIKTFDQNISAVKPYNFYLKASSLKIDNQAFLTITLLSGKHAFNLYKNNHFQLLAKDGTVLQLEIPVSKTSDLFEYKIFYAEQNFALSKEQIKLLKTKTFIKARYQISDGYIDIDIPEKYRFTFKTSMRCINEI